MCSYVLKPSEISSCSYGCLAKAHVQYRCSGTECGDNATGERYEGVCDKDGADWNDYRLGNENFYGPGSRFTVDTTRPFTVVGKLVFSKVFFWHKIALLL